MFGRNVNCTILNLKAKVAFNTVPTIQILVFLNLHLKRKKYLWPIWEKGFTIIQGQFYSFHDNNNFTISLFRRHAEITILCSFISSRGCWGRSGPSSPKGV